MKTSKSKPTCPICRKKLMSRAMTHAERAQLPFCSERCKMVDLNAWIREDYRIPLAIEPDTQDSDALLADMDEEESERDIQALWDSDEPLTMRPSVKQTAVKQAALKSPKPKRLSDLRNKTGKSAGSLQAAPKKRAAAPKKSNGKKTLPKRILAKRSRQR